MGIISVRIIVRLKGKNWNNYERNTSVSPKFCNILVCASFWCVYPISEAVMAIEDTCCSL